MTERVFLGLGSNLGKPRQNIHRAADLLRSKTLCEAAQLSPLYLTPPLGEIEQPDFVNAVLEIYTSLAPMELLESCKFIEATMGREKTERWGPRLIDIDILLYGSQIIQQENLEIPHCGLHKRSFVLFPLADLDAQLEVPGLGSVTALKAQLKSPEIRPL